TIAYFDPGSAKGLFDWRGMALALIAPLFAFGGTQDDRWRIRLSRAATFQSLSLLAISIYLAVMAVLVTALRDSGVDWTRAALIVLLAGMTVAAIVLLASRRARGWAQIKIAKHFSEHRYDYPTEWLRFTETIGASGPRALPLGQRVIKAFADILDAPGGLLLVADEHGAIEPAAAWNWSGSANPGSAIPSAEALSFWLAVGAEGRIIDFDAIAGGWADERDEAIGVPASFLNEEHA